MADTEWQITVQCHHGPEETLIGVPQTMRYSDSVVADGWEKVAYLLAGRLDEIRERTAPPRKKKP